LKTPREIRDAASQNQLAAAAESDAQRADYLRRLTVSDEGRWILGRVLAPLRVAPDVGNNAKSAHHAGRQHLGREVMNELLELSPALLGQLMHPST